MKLTGDQVKEVVTAVRESCPALAQMGDKDLTDMLHAAFQQVGITIQGIEARIKAAGMLPGDILVILLHYGAVVSVLKDLPGDDQRRQLVEGGAKLGDLITKLYGDKIAALLKKTVH